MKHAPQITATAQAAAIFTARHNLSHTARNVHVAYLSPEGWKTPEAWGVCEMPQTFAAVEAHTQAKALEAYLGEIPRHWQTITHAISVRQPWAWAIMEAGKDVENRPRRICPPAWYYLHASQKDASAEYERHRKQIIQSKGHALPDFPSDTIAGGIIGAIQITGWTDHSESPWFIGPKAAEIGQVFPLDFIPCPGKLGAFRPFP